MGSSRALVFVYRLYVVASSELFNSHLGFIALYGHILFRGTITFVGLRSELSLLSIVEDSMKISRVTLLNSR